MVNVAISIMAALLIVFGLLVIRAVRTEHDHVTEHVDRIAHRMKEAIIMSTQDTINTVVAQLGKAKGEIVTKIADLQAQIDDGVPAEELDLTALTEAAQALDDVVADGPAEPSEVPVDAPESDPAANPADQPF